MTLSVTDARTLAAALIAAADEADKAGQAQVDMLTVLESVDDSVREQLAAAIADARP